MPISTEKGDSSSNARVYNALDCHRKQFHLAFDLNQPAPMEMHNQHNSLAAGQHNSLEVEAESKENGKGMMMKREMDDDFGSGRVVEPKVELSSSPASSNISSYATFRASLLSSAPYLAPYLPLEPTDLPTLLPMRCTSCFLYVLSSKPDPKCGICSNGSWPASQPSN